VLEGKRIVVTGGASGIGKAAVRAFAAQRARLAVFDVADEAGERVAQEAGAHVEYYHCDVSDRAQVAGAFAAATRFLEGLDALVHAAAIERAGPVEQPDDETCRRVMDVNFGGTVYTNLTALGYLRANGGGRIVNFGSAAGVIGQPGASYYAASKGAVMAWTRNVAQEWARFGITVNAVAPVMDTPMYRANRERLTPEEQRALDRIFQMRMLG